MSSSDIGSSVTDTENKKVADQIIKVINEIDRGFDRVMLMYTIAFYAGIVIVFLAVATSLITGNNVFTYFFGTVGLLDIIAFFFFKPAENLQKSRATLAQLISAFVTWYSDLHTWAAAMIKEVNADNNPETLEVLSKRSLVNTFAILLSIHTFIIGEPGDKVKTNMQESVKSFQENIQNLNL